MKRFPFLILILFSLCLAAGCSKKQIQSLEPGDGEVKLAQILTEENELNIVLKVFEQTIWIYVPIEDELFKLKLDHQGAKVSNESLEVPHINYVETSFNDRSFSLEYDIQMRRKYVKTYGYTNTFTEDVSKIQQNILSAVSRSYFDMEEKDRPVFVAFVIANIVTGIEMQIMFALEDLKRAYADPGFQEEYTQRIVSDTPVGMKSILADKEGNHVAFHDITWEEFLAKQMNFRIRKKYEQSAFHPSADTQHEILSQVKRTIDAYRFDGFDSIILNNLVDGTEKKITPDELSNLEIKSPRPKGKLHTLKFNTAGEIEEDTIVE